MKYYFPTIIVFLTIVGCTNPVNRHTAIRYSEQAYIEMESGNWFGARVGFGRAITNAQIGGFDEGTMVNLWYEYGRASGVICDWVEAERGLNKALQIMEKHNDKRLHYVLVEIARMHMDRMQYTKALEYYERALPELERQEIETSDPLGYASYLSEYALVLDRQGRMKDSEGYSKRATALKQSLPNTNPDAQRTPYGTRCKENSKN